MRRLYDSTKETPPPPTTPDPSMSSTPSRSPLKPGRLRPEQLDGFARNGWATSSEQASDRDLLLDPPAQSSHARPLLLPGRGCRAHPQLLGALSANRLALPMEVSPAPTPAGFWLARSHLLTPHSPKPHENTLPNFRTGVPSCARTPADAPRGIPSARAAPGRCRSLG